MQTHLYICLFFPNVTTLRSGLCYCMSVCRLSSVTFVRHIQGVETFGNISLLFCTLAILWPPCKILRRSFQGNPSVGGVKRKRVAKYSDVTFRYLISRWVSCSFIVSSIFFGCDFAPFWAVFCIHKCLWMILLSLSFCVRLSVYVFHLSICIYIRYYGHGHECMFLYYSSIYVCIILFFTVSSCCLRAK